MSSIFPDIWINKLVDDMEALFEREKIGYGFLGSALPAQLELFPLTVEARDISRIARENEETFDVSAEDRQQQERPSKHAP